MEYKLLRTEQFDNSRAWWQPLYYDTKGHQICDIISCWSVRSDRVEQFVDTAPVDDWKTIDTKGKVLTAVDYKALDHIVSSNQNGRRANAGWEGYEVTIEPFDNNEHLVSIYQVYDELAGKAYWDLHARWEILVADREITEVHFLPVAAWYELPWLKRCGGFGHPENLELNWDYVSLGKGDKDDS